MSLYRVDVKFLGANPDPEIIASDETDDYTNYYLTNCPDGITHVPGFRKIMYRNIYPQIDLVLYTEHPDVANNYLEYDFIVHPGGDPSAIRMSYDHETALSVDEDGLFHLASPYGNLDETKPNGYQIGTDSPSQAGSTAPRDSVQCGFQLSGTNISFSTGKYDRTRDLYIDPPRVWGTYWGGTGVDELYDVATDRHNNIDVVGYTSSTSGIATSGAYQTTVSSGGADGYIASFSPAGNLRWATYYGGNVLDALAALSCDTGCGIVATGNTESTTGIASAGAYQTTFGDSIDAFIVSFDSTGVRRWATYFGGPGRDEGNDIAMDSSGNIVVVGSTSSSSGIATAGAYQTNFDSSGHNFIAKFTPNGSIIWATYYGCGDAVSCDKSNHIYIAGDPNSSGIATPGAYQTALGLILIAKFLPSGQRDWATYYFSTGSAATVIGKIAASRNGNLYLCGSTDEDDHATLNAYQQHLGGGFGTDGFLGRFDSGGHLAWWTYYGGSGYDGFGDIAVDTNENIVAGGSTSSPTAIASPGEYQTMFLGTPYSTSYEPFLVKFDSACHRRWGTYYGRDGYIYGVSIDPLGHPAVGGNTTTTTTVFGSAGAFLTSPPGDYDCFVARFCDTLEIAITSVPPQHGICPGTSVMLTAGPGLSSYQWNVNGSPIPGATTTSYSVPSSLKPGFYAYQVTGPAANAGVCEADSYSYTIIVGGVNIAMANAASVCARNGIMIADTCTGTGTLHYSWTPITGLDHPDSAEPIATPDSTTTYTLTVTDSAGCTASRSIVISVHSPPVLSLPTNISDCAGSPVPIHASIVGGQSPFLYTWTPATGLNRTDSSTVFATPSKTTVYVVTVTDRNGCLDKDSLLVEVNPTPKIDAGPSRSICQGGSIKIGNRASGGVGPYTYSWSPSTGLDNSGIAQPTASPDSTTLYIITVTDKNGCSSDDSVLVTVSDSLTPTIIGGPLTICTGDTAHLSAGTGYTSYLWSDGEKTSDIAVTQSGDYSVHVTGGTDCAGTSSITHVTVLPDSVPRPVLMASSTTICVGDSVQLRTSESYASYLWSTGDSTPTIFVSNTDTVSVTATNAEGCSGTSASLIIIVLPTPVAAVTSSGPDTLCFGDSLTLTAPSGYAHYEWSTGDTTISITVRTADAPFVTVTNAAGCSATSQPELILFIPTPELFVNGPAAVCPGATASYVDSTNAFGLGDLFTWQLTPPGSGTVTNNNPSSITVQWGAAGTATLIATETTPSGCSATAQLAVTIRSNLTPIVTASGPISFCPGDSVTLGAGAGYASYQWSIGGAQIAGATSERLTVNQSGAYTVFVTSAGGCSGTSAAENIVVYPTPASPVITRNGSELISTPASEYQWYVNGSILTDSVRQIIVPKANGSYTVTITDSNGCQSTSNPYAFSDTVILKAVVSVRGGLGTPGATISIPLVLDTGTNLPLSGAATYAASIILDGRMLKPINPVGVQAGNNWIVALSGTTSNAPGVLQTITALATDSGLCSDITIDTFYFPGAAIEVTAVSGTFCDTGTCTTVVTTGPPAFMIEKVYPNPSESSFTVEYNVAQDGPLRIAIEDYLGRTVTVLKDEWTTAGNQNATYSTQAISSGIYRLVMRSGANVANTVLVVAK